MFLMCYFATHDEALHLALSGDGKTWTALNSGQACFRSSIGAKSIRDPFLARDESGLFHLISTNGWNSPLIYHAVSDDLLNWRNEELLPVMATVPGTRNCWAPEAIWNDEEQLWHLFWSSTTPGSSDFDVHGYDHRIWSVSTRDWKTFSPPELFFDPGYNVIDATIARAPDGSYLMAFKDERGANERETPHKAIRVARAHSPRGSWHIEESFITPRLTEGPVLFRVADEWLMFYDCFMDGRFEALTSRDGANWRDATSEIEFPPHPRHGAVLEIENEVALKLQNYN